MALSVLKMQTLADLTKPAMSGQIWSRSKATTRAKRNLFWRSHAPIPRLSLQAAGAKADSSVTQELPASPKQEALEGQEWDNPEGLEQEASEGKKQDKPEGQEQEQPGDQEQEDSSREEFLSGTKESSSISS